jgi:NADPH-dependent F420 reductase
MRIAVLGGTGDFGGGLCLRWGADTDHEIRVGSRSAERARSAAESYSETVGREITGHENEAAAEGADIAVLAVAPSVAPEVGAAIESEVETLVCPAVEMHRVKGSFRVDAPEAGSIAEAVAEEVETPVVGALHPLPAARLADLDEDLGVDVPVAGVEPARERVVEAIEGIEGLRALHVGGLSCTREIESLTPLIINVGIENGFHDLGVEFK